MNIIMRFLHKRYANANGFFWLPCPICGEMFGGHKVKSGAASVPSDRPYIGRVVCPNCNNEARRLYPQHNGFYDGDGD